MEKDYNDPLGITDDELAEVTKEGMLANLKADIEAYKKRIEQIKADKENYETQLEIDRQMWAILERPESIQRIEPAFKYELDPDWYALQHQKQLFKIRMDRATAEHTLSQFDSQLQATEEALASAEERLAMHSEEE